jgi:hypothetical protein
MRGGLRGVKRCAGNDAKNQRGGGGEEQRGDDGSADGGLGSHNLLIFRGTLRRDESEAEVISGC